MKVRRKKLWILFFCAIVIAGAGVIYRKENNKVVYSELYGVWRSGEPRYKKCYLVIDKVSLIIGAADGKAYTYFLNSVEKTKKGETTLYTLRVRNPDGDKYSFLINCKEKATGKVLYFKNQPRVMWTKVKDRIDQTESKR